MKQIARKHGWFLEGVMSLAAFALASLWLMWLFGGVVRGQPVPCEQQAQRIIEAPLAIIIDQTDLATARHNREMIEQALSNGGTVNLPAGLIAVDRGVRIPSGSTLAGVGPKTIIRNCHTGTPFGDNCTLQIHPKYNDAGIGYADSFTRAGRTSITFADAATASRYNVGEWLYTFKWNGYAEPDGARTWVHRVAAKNGNTVTLNVEPQLGATHAAYTRAAVRISGALEGRTQVKIASGETTGFTPGKLVYITAGPVRGNECTGEMRRLMAVSSEGLTLDRPLRSTYPYQQSLAVLLNPVENVTIRDLTVQPFSDQAPPCFFQFATGLALQRLVTEGDIQCAMCQGVGIYDCQVAQTVNFNATRDALVTGGRCRHVYLEEYCADCMFANLLVSGSAVGGVLAPAGSPSERITLRDCVVEQARDMPIHLIGRECVVERCVVRNSANPVSWVNNYIGGDGTRIENFRSDLKTVFRRGSGVVVAGVSTPLFLGWSGPGDQPFGICVACPRVDTHFLSPATRVQWSFAASSVE